MSLKVRNLFSGYGKIDVLQGVSVTAERSRITAIIGPNGAGKSTLLKTICGYIKPRHGKIIYNGEDITGLKPYRIAEKGISYVFQRRSVFPRLTVLENLELGAWLIRKNPDKVRDVIEGVYQKFPELKEKSRAKAYELSGGMQRMLELARALISDPKLILVDEPSAGLAPKVFKEIYGKLESLRDEGITIILVDQNIRQAIKSADYIYVLELGKNRFEGSKDSLSTDLKALIKSWLRF
jgi:branched-chain amino acid transport system ATP-binding protein